MKQIYHIISKLHTLKIRYSKNDWIARNPEKNQTVEKFESRKKKYMGVREVLIL